MIGSLQGKIISKKPPQLLLDVGGVGYELQAPMSTFYKLPSEGESVRLITHLVVREDAHVLYGFASEHDRQLFRTIIKISGIGPKVALAILSGIDSNGLVRCVMDHDVSSLTRIPGVGKKTAERLIMELRDRIDNLTDGEAPVLPAGSAEGTVANAVHDAVSALISLGYKPQQASKAVDKVPDKQASSEELIKFALQNM